MKSKIFNILSLFILTQSFFAFVSASPYETYGEACFKRKKGKKFSLVEKGKPQCSIIVPSDVSPRTMEAVRDLKHYLQKISGADFPVEIGEPRVLPKKALWIGYQESLKKIFKKEKFSFKTEEIMILIEPNHIAILGDDGLNHLVKDVVIETELIPNAQSSYGTINAIYTFLQDFLGVRWFWPGESGEDYIKSKDIILDPVTFRYQPQMTMRYGVTSTFRPGRRAKMRPGDEWSARQRLFYSSAIINLGHPFKEWWRKYGSKFPEIFALTIEGKRKPINDGKDVKFCLTSPQFPEIWINDLKEQLKSNPFIKYINVGENDSYHTGHCVCENCTKLDVRSVYEKEKLLSDRHVHFANRLASALNMEFGANHPFKVLYSAYGNNRALPLEAKLRKDVSVISVHNFHLRRAIEFDVTSDLQMSQFLDWSKQTDEIFWRPNLGNPVGLTWGFYDVAFSQSFENFNFIAKNKCKGVYFDLYRDHWATQGIQYYVDGQLAWNPYLKKDQVLEDYFSRLYGPAKKEMQEFWELVESTRNALFEEHGMIARLWVHERFDEKWFEKAERLFETAEAKLKNADKKFKIRLDFSKKGLQYAKTLVKLRLEMVSVEKGNKLNQNSLERCLQQIKQFESSFEDQAINFKVLDFNWQAKLNKSLANRMEGLIPNAPITRKTLRLIDEEGLD